MVIVTAILSDLVAGSLIYCLLIMAATRSYLSARRPVLAAASGISILKPLGGHDEGLEDNLRSFFGQEYPEFEVLLAVHRASDPATAVVAKVMDEYAGKVNARLIVTGESSIPNAKAFNLNRLVREARH